MSISGMNRAAVTQALAQRGVTVEVPPHAPVAPAAAMQGVAPPAAGDVAPAAHPTAAEPQSNVLDALVHYIPAEIITLYVAFLGVAAGASGSYTARWVGAAVFLVLTPLFVWADWRAKVRATGHGDGANRLPLSRFNLVAATVAFAAWVLALPNGPFTELGFYNEQWAGFIALAASVVLGIAATIWGPLSSSPS